MDITTSAGMSRRQFLVAGGLAVAARCLVLKGLFAQGDDVLVPNAFKTAGTAKVTLSTS